MKLLGVRRRLGALALIGFATVLCMAASGGCGSSLHKANVSAASIAAGLHSAATINHENALETPQEKALVAGYIKQAASANDNFIGALQVAQAQGASASPVAIEAALQALINEVTALNAQGVLQIKDPQAKAVFADIMAGIQVSLSSIEALYPSAPGALNQPSDNRSPGHKPVAPWMALMLTPAEVEELIALALTAGSALVSKLESLRGESDAQLLAGASADDAAAEQIAGEDAGS